MPPSDEAGLVAALRAASDQEVKEAYIESGAAVEHMGGHWAHGIIEREYLRRREHKTNLETRVANLEERVAAMERRVTDEQATT